MNGLKILVAATLLATASMVAAQTKPEEAKPQSQQPQAGAQQPAAPQAPTGGTAVHPSPKTKEEATAYTAMMQIQDPAALETAVEDFVTKYPDSTLKAVSYQRAMLVYENTGNYDKAVELGKKALSIDADDPLTNAETASMIASRTRATDLDMKEKLADVTKYSEAAIANIDNPRVDEKADPNMVQALKSGIKAQAYNAQGLAAFVNKDYPKAEVAFQKSVDANPAQPEAVTLLRLGVSQTNQGKLEPALASLNKSIELANQGQQQQVVALATAQRDAVQKQIDKKKAAAAPPATPAK
jgi:tetratricopeptide (TPR) repeat protein